MKNKYTTVRILKIDQETPKVKNFFLDTTIDAKPGQYVMVWIPRVGEKPFAIGKPSPVLLSIARVGLFTEKIHKLKVGDKMTFRGPYGSSFTPKGKRILLVGGGYGMVPLCFIALQTPKARRKQIVVVIGARTKSDLVFVSKFKNLGCKVEVSTDDGSVGFKGFSTDLAKTLLDKEKFDSVATCGPNPMMKKVAQMCDERKIYCQVSVETHFKCGGLGLCGECSFSGRIVCKEGPVFAGRVLLSK